MRQILSTQWLKKIFKNIVYKTLITSLNFFSEKRERNTKTEFWTNVALHFDQWH